MIQVSRRRPEADRRDSQADDDGGGNVGEADQPLTGAAQFPFLGKGESEMEKKGRLQRRSDDI